MKLYDISRTISEQLPVWPGDPAVKMSLASSLERGDDVNVTSLCMSAHAGTHIDAPSHVLQEGKSVDQLPLEILIGTCRVQSWPALSGIIGEADLQKHDYNGVQRVLFKNDISRLPEEYPSSSHSHDVSLGLDGAAYLIRCGIRLVGTDAFSIEKADAPGYPVHSILLRNHVIILEGLNLSEVPPGDYELIALPMKLKGADGAPARVVLRTF